MESSSSEDDQLEGLGGDFHVWKTQLVVTKRSKVKIGRGSHGAEKARGLWHVEVQLVATLRKRVFVSENLRV